MNEISNKQKIVNEAQGPRLRVGDVGSSVSDVVHFFVIKVYDKRGGLGSLIEFLKWENLTFDLRQKYDWYFRYRAALLQVKYPKYIVDVAWGNEPATGKTLEEIRQDKIRAKKSKITQYKNKLKKAELSWSSLFPIEDDFDYIKAVEKINRLEFELHSL